MLLEIAQLVLAVVILAPCAGLMIVVTRRRTVGF